MSLQEQFEHYYDEYHTMVYALCLGYSKGDKALTDDLVQEVFIKIWSALSTFEARSSVKTWIYRICVNTCLLHIRKHKNKQAEPLETVAHLEEPSSDKDYHTLYKAIGQLKKLERIIIMLVLDDVSNGEIADITGLTEGNIRVKISRTKQKLSKILSHEHSI